MLNNNNSSCVMYGVQTQYILRRQNGIWNIVNYVQDPVRSIGHSLHMDY
jgi:hypothetical protein